MQAPSLMIRSEISRQINLNLRKNEEVKHSITTYTDINPAYPTSILSPTVLDFRATIPVGTDPQSRIGQRVRLKSYTFRVAAWAPSNSTVPACVMRFVFYKLRGSPSTTPTLSQLNSIKRSNTAGVSTGIYTSTKTTQLTPYNSEFFEILAQRDLKLGLASPSSGAASIVPNNDFSLSAEFSIDMSSFLKHDIRFDPTQALGNVAVNDGLFCSVMCLDFQEQVNIASSSTCRFDAVLDLEFTDA